MISSMRSIVLKALSTGFILLALAGPSQSARSAEEDRGWDTEIPCCFLIRDFLKGWNQTKFTIQLHEMDRHVAEMHLTMPSGIITVHDPKTGMYTELPSRTVVLGFDEKTRRYTRPGSDWAYGLLVTAGISLKTESPQWQGRASRVFVVNQEKGQHILQVIGVHDGRYTLTFYPAGWPSDGSRHRNEYRTDTVSVKAGEIHTYEFSLEFDRDRANPIFVRLHRFHWKRVK